jgi:DNA adenine methylase
MTKPRVYGEYINDLDNEIVNLFRVLQDKQQASELIRLLTLTPFARAEFDRAYRTDTPVDPIARACRLCILSYMGFSSCAATGYRTGFRCRSFRTRSTPARDWMNYPEHLWKVVDRLRGVTVENCPALEFIRLIDTPETLFYVDPPYLACTRTISNAYRREMTDAEHISLAAALHDISGMAVISGYDSKLYRNLYANWTIYTKLTRGDGQNPRTECLWVSPRTILNYRPLLPGTTILE